MKKSGKYSVKSYINKVTFNEEYITKPIIINNEISDYMIRSNGIVESFKVQSMKDGKPHLMYGNLDIDGYRIVNLTHKGKKYTLKIHRLVAEAFIPNPFDKPEVNHKDGDKLNNDVSNLEWVFQWENVNHACEYDLRFSTYAPEYIHLVCSLLESNEHSLREISDITGVEYGMVRKIYGGICHKSISDQYNIRNYSPNDHTSKIKQNKLSDETVHDICKELVKGDLYITEIARKYNTTATSVIRFRNHKARKDITEQYNFDSFNSKGINQFIKKVRGEEVENDKFLFY